MYLKKGSAEDPFEKESNIQKTLKEARLLASGTKKYEEKPSLKQPTRPFTPTVDRGLFNFDTTGSRPGSAAVLQQLNSSNFLESLQPSPSLSMVTPPTSPCEHKNERPRSASIESATQEDGNSKSSPEWQKLKEALISLKTEKDTNNVIKLLNNILDVMNTFEPPQARRNQILKILYRLLDTDNSTIQIKVCKIALKLKDVSKNCTYLLYKLSKEEGNDNLFRLEQMIEPILKVSTAQLEDDTLFDVILYSMGAIKNISTNEINQVELNKLHAVHIISNWINKENIQLLETKEAKKEAQPSNQKTKKGTDRVAQFLIQVTGTLRNLASSNVNKADFVDSSCIVNLCKLLEPDSTFTNRYELMLNIARIFSKLTMFGECRAIILKQRESLKGMLLLLQEYNTQPAFVVRMAFVLGNLTAMSNKARSILVQEQSALDIIAPILIKYSKPELAQKIEAEEVLIKLIRLVANLSISESIGPLIARLPEIKVLQGLLETRSSDTSEELVLNIIGSITNLSYYSTADNIVLQHQYEISEMLLPFLLSDNDETVIETARAFGNFSRNKKVCELISKKQVDEVFILLLDHSNREVVYNVCGVLMNLMTFQQTKITLQNSEGIERLIEVFNDSLVTEDIQLADIVAKTIWNFSLENGVDYFSLTHVEVLRESLDKWKEKIPQYEKKVSTESFEQVASQLIDMLKNQPLLIPLPAQN